MKPYTLKDREGESISPMTSTRTVFDERGVDLDTLLAQQKQGLEAALKEYPKKTEVVEGLAGKQNALSTTTDLHITDDNIIGLTEAAKMRLFIDLWNAACGKWGKYDPDNAPDPEHPFYLNELWLTYEEAVEIYLAGAIDVYDCAGFYRRPRTNTIRTNLPRRIISQQGYNTQGFNAHNFMTMMEVLNLEPYWGEDPNGFIVDARLVGNDITSNFYNFAEDEWLGLSILKKIIGVINLSQVRSQDYFNALTMCYGLIEVRIKNCGCNVKLAFCRALSLDSLKYLVDNATNTTAIIITVASEVYAKLTDETNAEWHAVLVAAAEKNITFATV